MLLFGLGTLPMMLGIVFFGQFYKKFFVKFQKWVPLDLILFGLLFIIRGSTLAM